MTDLTGDQIDLERDMQALGELRYRSRAAHEREHERGALLPPERALVRGAVDATAALIAEWLKSAKAGPVVNGTAAPYLSRIRPDRAALIGLTVVTNHLHRTVKASTLGAKIGRYLQDEDRFTRVAREAPGVTQMIRRITRKNTTEHARRVAGIVANRERVALGGWPFRERVGAGQVVLDAVNRATGLLEFEVVPTGPTRKALLARPTAAAVDWLASADERAALASPLLLPCYDPPRPWTGVADGGYHTDLVARRSIARFQGPGQRRRVEEAGVPPGVLRALNALQGVRYRVNDDLLEVAAHLARERPEVIPGIVELPVPPRPPDIATNEGARRAWRREAGPVMDENAVRRSRAGLVHRTVAVARRVQGRALYFPHQLDFRGRAYPLPLWLQPQAGEIGRALLEFADPAPCTPAAWGALLEQGAKLHGGRGPRADLRANGEALLGLAREVHTDPLEVGAWSGAKEPWAFLAWCLEVGRLLDDPGGPTHLPCHVDASSNGFQLYSLMTGDRALAAATNAIPGPGQPSKLYARVALAATEELRAAVRRGGETAAEWARALASLQGLREGEAAIPEAAAKRVVMTVGYGVTLWSAREYVREWYDDAFDRRAGPFGERPGKACEFLARLLMRAVDGVCGGAVGAMRWLQDIAGLYAERGESFAWRSPSGWPVVQAYHRRKRISLRCYLAGTVRHLKYRGSSGPVDEAAQRRGAAPNFVHGVDAAVMADFVGGWGRPVVAVHDDFACHAAHYEDMHAALRASTAHVAVTGAPLHDLRRQAESHLRLELPEPPCYGTIEPGEVLEAGYLFQ